MFIINLYQQMHIYTKVLSYITNAPLCFSTSAPSSGSFDISFAKVIIIFIISIQSLDLFWQEPKPSQAKLHSRQVLRGGLPLLSPAFGRCHIRRQIPPRPHQRERS
jgi:hypothetical protein